MDAYENLGTNKSDPETNAKIRKFLAKESNLENIARIALSRFPESEFCGGSVEGIRLKEIRTRFNEIKNAGYGLKAYSALNKEEAFQYLMQLRKEIRSKALKYCPEVLTEINSRNKEQKIEKYLLR